MVFPSLAKNSYAKNDQKTKTPYRHSSPLRCDFVVDSYVWVSSHPDPSTNHMLESFVPTAASTTAT